MTDASVGTRVSDVMSVGIPVADVDAAIEFYVGKLGFEKRRDTTFRDRRWVEVAPPGAKTTIALVAVDSQATGIDTQVRLASGDVQADHSNLQARGVDVDADIIPYPVPMFAFRDIDGNRVIIVGMQPQSGS